jgi:GNAT superfamily N-acetyltransferase
MPMFVGLRHLPTSAVAGRSGGLDRPSVRYGSNMRGRPELSMANDNLVGAYCKLAEYSTAGAVHEIGPVVNFVTGAPVALFNGCLLVRPASAADFDASVDLLDAQNVPYQVWIADGLDEALAYRAAARGLTEDGWTMPGMVLLAPWTATIPPLGISISEVVDAPAHRAWLSVIVDAGMPKEVAQHLFPASFAADGDVRLFTAFLNGAAVGTSLTIRTGEVCGVYSVVTLPKARRRGVGTAAAWAAVDAARGWGCRVVVLQASAMGLSSYERMGFQTVLHYRIFERSAAQ